MPARWIEKHASQLPRVLADKTRTVNVLDVGRILEVCVTVRFALPPRSPTHSRTDPQEMVIAQNEQDNIRCHGHIDLTHHVRANTYAANKHARHAPAQNHA